ncbi:MAG: hypothetical protein JWL62_13 [Hyphomicrobiales bacterium]|nr:hypothetical protein [Hyphomicrobiales bacterium]
MIPCRFDRVTWRASPSPLLQPKELRPTLVGKFPCDPTMAIRRQIRQERRQHEVIRFRSKTVRVDSRTATGGECPGIH